MKNTIVLMLGAATLAASAHAETPLIPHPGAPSAVVRSGPAATMGPTAAPNTNSTPAQLPVPSTPQAIPNVNAATIGYQPPITVTQYPQNQQPILQEKQVTSVLPSGTGTYVFYREANTYYNPRTSTYYYLQGGEWRAGVSAPVGKHLGQGQTVRLQGQSNVNGANN